MGGFVIILAFLKIIGAFHYPWWVVFLPMIIELILMNFED